MSISQSALRYFVALAEELHLTRAARALYITPPSLSQQISRLERQVGRELFHRSRTGMRLTAAGRELLPLARRAVLAHREVEDWAASRVASSAELRLGIVASGAGPMTSHVVAEALRADPGLRLELMHLGFFDAVPALERGAVDIAIILAPFSETPGYIASPIWSEPRVLVVRDDHPLAGRSTIHIDETNDLDFVIPTGASGVARDWWLVDPRPDGTRPKVVAYADDVAGLMEFCAAGVAVNIASQSAATHFGRPGLAHIDIVDIEPAQMLLVRSAHTENPAVRAFERLALDVSQRLSADRRS